MLDLEEDTAERAASEERMVAMVDAEEDTAERRVALDTSRIMLPLHRY
jgi:hypothetical protein